MALKRFEEHNAAVKQLWDDYGRNRHARVPIRFAFDEQFRLPLYGCTFRQYYTDPLLQVRVQLETEKQIRERLVQDSWMGVPEGAWTVAPVQWMDEKEFFGCEVVFQDDDYAWARPIRASKPDLLAWIRDIDPLERVRESRLFRFYTAMKEAVEDLEFHGQPVTVGFPGGTHGLFTTAAEVRGLEQLCLDLKEDPDFVREYLDLVADRILGRLRAWYQLAGIERDFPSPDGWGMADDSLQLISAQSYREFVLPVHERMYAAMTTGPRHIHLCGHVRQHFRVLHEELGIMSFDGPGPHLDLGEIRAEIGEDVHICGRLHTTVLQQGPREAIDAMIRGFLTPAAKRGGRLDLLVYAARGTPWEHLQWAYESGIRHGALER